MATSERSHTTASAIKDLILERGLQPGDPMPTESELMDELNVSRSSVREAVRTLVALDILHVRHGTGTFVGMMSLRPLVESVVFRGVLNPGGGFDSLRDVVEVRIGLDSALAPRIVERLAHTEAPELAASVEAMLTASVRSENFFADDRAFHLQLAERLGNRLYGELVGAFWDIHRAMSPRLGMVSREDLAETAQAHADMLAAGLRGDLDAYRSCIQAHYVPLLRMLDKRHEDGAASLPTLSA